MEFDLAAKAVLRAPSVSDSQRMSSKVLSAPLQRQISGQIAAAAVYANQASAANARPLGPIFPRVADINLSSDSIDDDAAAAPTTTTTTTATKTTTASEATATALVGDAKVLETELVAEEDGSAAVSFPSSGKKKAKKRKSGQGVRQA